MCKYCEQEGIIFVEEFISRMSLGWGGDVKIKESDAELYKVGIFIDRGYLRMVDLDDCECIDHGKLAKIFYCPFCGKKI